jgi:hypothetical protein
VWGRARIGATPALIWAHLRLLRVLKCCRCGHLSRPGTLRQSHLSVEVVLSRPRVLCPELRMPRYFFHLEGREERIADRQGQMLPDEAAALREAKLASAALREYRRGAWRVIVTNEWGHEVTQIPIPLEASG